jgi:hypothetical protein
MKRAATAGTHVASREALENFMMGCLVFVVWRMQEDEESGGRRHDEADGAQLAVLGSWNSCAPLSLANAGRLVTTSEPWVYRTYFSRGFLVMSYISSTYDLKGYQ